MKILITGISSGIGEKAAYHLQGKGWEVTGLDYRPPQGDFDWHQIDLSDLDALAKFMETFRFNFDAMFYAAGTREICEPVNLPLHTWQRTLNVNLTAAFLLAQSCIQDARINKRKLNIVFVSSISGLQAEPERAAYVSSKFALHGLTKQLAMQYGPEQIRINAIAPGIIETPLTMDYFKDEVKAALIRKSTPVGYWGKPEHIMPVLDLCLQNDYINGAIMVCDGGWTTGKEL
ncbi:SDR family NAD(P)-dependent oxidoreductase [Legionella londiniensis]|uniref:Short-chain dehydrogenase/reductase n=1 Tax=Legionella londiniensis TaxID=45068 RepID=A0A0W0VI67_9GAMM|nr:SDR family oxidoreductase [Legionella londiniensis]KTD19820.1 short-chain dehydrogenase/reductase [Legionella londiniensis]STX92268.1 short-chain dehydrogenase/reductase [Legionella londiniensis]